MQQPPVPAPFSPNAEERVFFARLAALNAAFDAARAGKTAKSFADRASSIDALLDRYFVALTSQSNETDPQ